MRIYHLNCASLFPLGGRLIGRSLNPKGQTHLVCHCLLIESPDGLILINTGPGLQDVLTPQKRLGSLFLKLMRPSLNVHDTAVNQVIRLGYRASDVKHIILTHLDANHVGGLDDFPNAQLHVMQAELKAAMNPKNTLARIRYPKRELLSSKSWNTYYAEGEKWFGMDAVRHLVNMPEEILLIPLCGYTEGHAGVAVKTDQGWLLHAGNAYFFQGELNQDYNCPAGLRVYQKLMQINRKMRVLNQIKLRDLSHEHQSDLRIFCSHDPTEFEDLKRAVPRLLFSDNEALNNILWMRPNHSTQSNFSPK
jgi:glyoxylase-like metal-dependent hydrolase (beta-lactamase superfamily II)